MKNKNLLSNKELINEDVNFPEYFYVTDELDLHGFFPEQVSDIVNEFIKNAAKLSLHTLRIIHGKGKSKMKWTVHQVLKDHPDVFLIHAQTHSRLPPPGLPESVY